MDRKTHEIITKSAEDTRKVASDVAKTLHGGEVIALYGDLGSGKTTFTQGMAKGLGVKGRIISPTFVIMRRHKVSIKYQVLSIKYLYHVDLYRVEDEKGLVGLGLDEIINNPQNIIAIEWAERMGRMLSKKRIDIWFEYIDEGKRRKIRFDNKLT